MSDLRRLLDQFRRQPLWLRAFAAATPVVVVAAVVAGVVLARRGDDEPRVTEALGAITTPTSAVTPGARVPTPTPGAEASSVVRGPQTPSPVSEVAPATETAPLPPEAEAARQRLAAATLQPADVPPTMTDAGAHFRTNEEALADAPADAVDVLRSLNQQWGRLYVYDRAYAAPPSPDLLGNGAIARLQSSASLFATPEGAEASVAFNRDLDPAVVAAFVEALGTADSPIRDVTAERIDFPAYGDSSHAWRFRGVVTVSGLDLDFVADSVTVRVGDIAFTVTAITLNQPPPRRELEGYVRLLAERIPRS
ncbi:MAG TPA: hypothetical protein VNM43_10300 [Dehalococcoidia bacterium]|nr:hypothetical protein [Dehalococcoidia bacterium]